MLITKLYSAFIFVCVVRSARPANSSTRHIAPLILNGHYVMWQASKTQDKFINDNRYIPKNIIYTRFQLCSDRVFLAAPRYKRGVPFTLGYLKLGNDQDTVYNYVKPFPRMDKQDAGTAVESLVNVIDLVMGRDGVIWVLDAGVSDTLGEHPSRDSDPKVVGFDAVTGKVRHAIALRTLSCRAKSRLQYLAVEYVTQATTVLYVGDGGTRSIIVWCVQSNDGYRVKLPHGAVRGCSENAQDADALYMALVDADAGNYLYFTYLSSEDVFRVRTRDLRKQRCVDRKRFVNMGQKPFKMVFLGVGHGSVLYFRVRGRNHLYGWDTKRSFLEENFVIVRKSKDCRTITHVDVDNHGVLWVLESNIQDFITDQVGSYGPCMMLTPVSDAPVPISNEFNKSDDSIS